MNPFSICDISRSMSQAKSFQFEVNTSIAGLSLKHGLHRILTEIRHIPISKRELKELIDKGKVHLNRSKAFKSGIILKEGDKIIVELPRSFLKAKDDDIKIAFEITQDDVLFEDDAIIAINKPSGLSTQASLDPKRDHLYAAVRRYLESNTKREVYVGLHHRLDVDTSGVVVFTKKKSANKGLGNQFEFRKIQKSYLAVCLVGREQVASKWTIKNHLGRSKEEQEKKMLRMQSVKVGGDLAETFFRILEEEELSVFGSLPEIYRENFEAGKWVALEARPKTGRTHQIRVHLSEDQLPILGDRFYYIEDTSSEHRLHLHAYSIEFKHPITEEPLVIKAPFKLKV